MAVEIPEEAGLTAAQLDFWKENGYLLIPDEYDKKTVAELLEVTHEMLDSFSLDDHPMTKFTTEESGDNKHVGDEYFLTSNDKVRFFFEEGMYLYFQQSELIGKTHLILRQTNSSSPKPPR
jgi:phytanoyl-CoA hydroxylase